MLTDKISEQDLTKYNASAKICGIVMKEIFSKIKSAEILDTLELNKYGDARIREECEKIYKRELVKGVAFPTSISLNDCVGNYIYENGRDEYNKIKQGDIIKIELGVNIGGCIAVLGETLIYEDASQDDEKVANYIKYMNLLEELKGNVIKLLIAGNINDDIKIMIESKCTEGGCFPVENTISYQHLDAQVQTFESKYIITNYQKYYDDDDNLAVQENVCFEFEEGDVYTINLCIIPNDYEQMDETTHTYMEPHDPHIYRFNDQYHAFRLKMTRDFVNAAKNVHGTNAFNCLSYKQDSRYRVGIKQCLESGILDYYPVLYSKDKYPVLHKKFTVVVGDKKCFTLKYI
jgi:methionine aminopeptidase